MRHKRTTISVSLIILVVATSGYWLGYCNFIYKYKQVEVSGVGPRQTYYNARVWRDWRDTLHVRSSEGEALFPASEKVGISMTPY